MHPLDVSTKATILVVDDTSDNLSLMSVLLKDHYNVRVANSGARALKLAATGNPPDMILLDVMMPEMDGYEVCRRLKADSRLCHIPIIFLTARSDVEDEKRGLDLGAIDYIAKPINPPIVMARLRAHLALKSSTDFLRGQNEYLEQEVEKRTREVEAIQEVTILAMASLAETRDSDTGNHIRRTQFYVKALAERLKTHPRFSRYLTERNITLMYKSAPLHDIGKVGIPDRILLKPKAFEPAEFEIMKRHSTLGWQAIEHAERSLRTDVEFLSIAKQIALSHHEKWDGTGYPAGLSGDDIPIPARLMALADVYDALISRRIYKEGMSHEKATDIIRQGKACHFDPDIVDAFLDLQDEFQTIAARYADSDGDMERKSKFLADAVAEYVEVK